MGKKTRIKLVGELEKYHPSIYPRSDHSYIEMRKKTRKAKVVKQRTLPTGDNWKPFLGGKYFVSKDGKVYSYNIDKLIKPVPNRMGYLSIAHGVSIKRIRYSVHVIVMALFKGPKPSGYVINHINAIKSDNRLDNLEYVTPEQNRQHAVKMRLYINGEKASKVLTLLDVQTIKKCHEIGMNGHQLARAYKVNKSTVTKILSGKHWKYVCEE